ncbi:hypothetical protein BMA10247_A0134 [Burkholderia mallei NCTC 10247]|nr:hypothetical protein BMASAVP1_1274 [Burkholderia mallei SAVP1]ABO01991.1 hypothetical protein BMA10247_A0134 [Burkholderia mallei NCTC 10247]EDK52994.1 hypothetical protein BMAFMH_K0043 [Burkholderia mallei FMH]EDK57965.1 hypothetical protein BMAJHU_E0042 [Burkholderia mallei JHU]EDO89256.1 hypothetical protein BURPSPAST_AC0257 [Burkholderia pseudomallei Pasteur 52237]EDP87120.1 hypothetical protein BMA10399_B1321 [Burkholderia mallei ATCC 10399]EDS83904.1 hypothetical protein BURPSS13_X08
MCFEDRYDPPHSPGQCRTVSPVNRPAARSASNAKYVRAA